MTLEELITKLVDIYIEAGEFEFALKAKWMRVAELQGRIR